MIKKILAICLCLLTIVSCTKQEIINQGETFTLSDEFYNVEEANLTIVNDYDVIQELIDNKKSFVVFVYLSGCLTCASFEPIVKEYLSSTKVKGYSINYPLASASRNDISRKVKYAPAFLIFENGKIRGFLDSTRDEQVEYFGTVSAFKTWFESYVEVK